jgi:hypothetical protein
MDGLALEELKGKAWDEISVECRNQAAHDTSHQTLFIKLLPSHDQYQLLVSAAACVQFLPI